MSSYEGPERRQHPRSSSSSTSSRDDAYQAGRRAAQIDARLDSHEAWLNAINGSIDRMADGSKMLTRAIADLDEKIDKVITDRTTEQAVNDACLRQIEEANRQADKARESMVSTRMFAVGVATVVLMLAGLIATIMLQGHHP